MVRSMQTAWADGTALNGAESVLIRVPAHREYIVVVRSVLAQLGARLGYTVAEIIDLRLVVDETCGLLVGGDREDGSGSPDGSVPLDGPARGDLECRVRVSAGTLQVTVRASAVGVRPPNRDGFGWKVLTALVDTMTWAREGSTARIDLVKRHHPQPL